jgi:hypothetical protein
VDDDELFLYLAIFFVSRNLYFFVNICSLG